jgi:threonine dehydrogenase-like Zn-dependent dehydrogenase
MKALKPFAPHDLRVVDIAEPPSPAAGEVKIAVRASGICGSDKWYWNSGPTKEIAGHEVCGQVIEVGSDVTGLHVNDRVAANNVVGCGQCPACLAGQFVRCMHRPGRDVGNGFSEYLIAPARNCLILHDSISYADGCLIFDNWGTPYAALKRGNVGKDDTLVITGAGPIGLGATFLGKLLGARVITIDPVAYRREAALRLGADIALAPAADTQATLRQLTGDGPSVWVDCSGRGDAYELGLSTLRTEGRFVCVGEHAEFMLHPSDYLLRNNLNIYGTWYSTMEEGAEVQRLMVQGCIKPQAFVTHRVTLAEAPAAFARSVQMSEDTLKTIILMNGN